MDSGFSEFLQTPRGRIFSLLGFYSHFSVFRMFESIEAIRGCWIGPKTWDRINTIFLKPNGAARSCSTAVWGMKMVFSGLNHVLVGFEAGSGREMRVQNMNLGLFECREQ